MHKEPQERRDSVPNLTFSLLKCPHLKAVSQEMVIILGKKYGEGQATVNLNSNSAIHY
jgi:hypothetical protein